MYLVVYDRQAYEISSKLFSDIKSYIDDRYVEEHRFFADRGRAREEGPGEMDGFALSAPAAASPACLPGARGGSSLEELIGQVDESFSQMLLRTIDEAGISDSRATRRPTLTASSSPRYAAM